MSGTTADVTLQVFDALVRGRGTAKEAAIRAMDGAPADIDRDHLRILVTRTLTRDFPPPRAGQKDDMKASDTRCWLLSALGRLAAGDAASEEVVRHHLDRNFEPYKWARYWALEGLVVGKAADLELLALKLATPEEDALVSSLATAILAASGNVASLSIIQHKLRGREDEAWAALRALRIVPIAETPLVRQLIEIVEAGSYSDSTFDAIVALSKIPAESSQADAIAQALSNYLISYRWPMYDAMRTKALIALGNLRVQRTAAVLIEELSDDSPAIVFHAARSLESVLGVRNATKRVVEASIHAPTDALLKLANALRSMNRTAVVEELEAIMLAGAEEQQEPARLLLSEVGGAEAFQRLRARTNAVKQYIGTLEQAEAKIRQLFEDSIVEARQGFRLASIMDVVVFALGVVLIAGSAATVLLSGGTLTSWAGVGTAAGTGVLGVLYSLLISNPRRQVREAVDHLMHLKIVFLGYLRQLHQADQAYTRRLLEDKALLPAEVAAYSQMVGDTMLAAALRLTPTTSAAPRPASQEVSDVPGASDAGTSRTAGKPHDGA